MSGDVDIATIIPAAILDSVTKYLRGDLPKSYKVEKSTTGCIRITTKPSKEPYDNTKMVRVCVEITVVPSGIMVNKWRLADCRNMNDHRFIDLDDPEMLDKTAMAVKEFVSWATGKT